MWRVIRVAGAGVAGTATLASVDTSNGTIRMSTAAEAAHGNVIVETQNNGVVCAEIHKPNCTVDDASSKGPLARLMTLFDHVRIPTAEAQAASKTAYKPPPFAPWDFNWDGREGAGGKGTRRLVSECRKSIVTALGNVVCTCVHGCTLPVVSLFDRTASQVCVYIGPCIADVSIQSVGVFSSDSLKCAHFSLDTFSHAHVRPLDLCAPWTVHAHRHGRDEHPH